MREEIKGEKPTTCGKDQGLDADSEYINLKVAGQDGSNVHFKIKKLTPLRKLMKAYCERLHLSMENVRFRFDGEAINEADSPANLKMEENDTIEVFQQQSGGYELNIPNDRIPLMKIFLVK